MLGGILLNVLVTLLIVTSLTWTLFHWKVVLLGVQKNSSNSFYQLGRAAWWFIIFIHPVLLVGIWFLALNLSILIFCLIVMHGMFGRIFATNIDAR